MKTEKIISDAEQGIQSILENQRNELDEFINDEEIEHNAAKALISYTLAVHFALRSS